MGTRTLVGLGVVEDQRKAGTRPLLCHVDVELALEEQQRLHLRRVQAGRVGDNAEPWGTAVDGRQNRHLVDLCRPVVAAVLAVLAVLQRLRLLALSLVLRERRHDETHAVFLPDPF